MQTSDDVIFGGGFAPCVQKAYVVVLARKRGATALQLNLLFQVFLLRFSGSRCDFCPTSCPG